MVTMLKYGVIASALICLVSLTFLVLKTFSFGKRQWYAAPRGNVKKGIIYAFGKGMMPWEKESAKKHLPSYIGGILYHTGVFAAFFFLLFTVVSPAVPQVVLLFIRLLCPVGVISGLALLLKRVFSPPMRALSCPDDFAANIIVDIFVILALLNTFYAEITPFFFLAAIIMFLYLPLGKIRHCFFFFYVRILFGIFYGRRNVFPAERNPYT
jgi:nitrate reductase gamma subunit